jgi:type VI secretion system protein VasG
MSDISRAKLFSKLTPTAYQALEAALDFCKRRGNPYVELVHWLFELHRVEHSDVREIARRFELSHDRLQVDFTRALDALRRGASSAPDLSSQVDDVVERGWTYASIMFGELRVRTAHLLIGALKTTSLRNALLGISREFERIQVDALIEQFDAILAGSAETAEVAAAGMSTPASDGAAGAGSALERYSVDLTAKARAGEIDPVLGRDEEIRQIIDVLMRRRQNNPILTGEAGVGKTSVVEGFALRVARGDVPPALAGVTVAALDLGLLQAGAGMKGEFESRLRQVIDEVQGAPQPPILFIDEAHTLIGAGGAQGTGDAANLLKPALARGKLRTIAATTWAEYKRYFEKDPALTRRFQVVQVDEPDEERALQMLRGVVPVLQQHHGVRVLDEAVAAAVRLSHRYIPARQLPDKAVSLLDTACARVAVSQHATPPAVEDARSRREVLATELGILEREARLGAAHERRVREIGAQIAALDDRIGQLEGRWSSEKGLVGEVLALRARIEQGGERGEGEGGAVLLPELAGRQAALQEVQGGQGGQGLVAVDVDDMTVAAVVQDWTGIPVGKMVGDEVRRVLSLADTLARRVIGQEHGLATIARRIHTTRAKLDDPDKPIGVFMLCGPSGVGKTETALALADAMYGGEQNLITINMSEYQEAHTVSSLKGAPPGYVGYGEGGVLTEAVRRKPYSVVLLDEVEKAHPDVHEIFFQVFDKGWMEDGEGRRIDFRNTLILLTSNVGTEAIARLCAEPARRPGPDVLEAALREPLLGIFPAALLGRIVVVPYVPLADDMLARIVRLQLDRVARRFRANHDAEFAYDDAVVRLVVSRCTQVESGGRMIAAILTHSILPRLSEFVLGRLIEGRALARIAVGVDGAEFTYRVE